MNVLIQLNYVFTCDVAVHLCIESNSFRFMWFHQQIRWMRFMETTINNEFYMINAMDYFILNYCDWIDNLILGCNVGFPSLQLSCTIVNSSMGCAQISAAAPQPYINNDLLILVSLGIT